jgi:hypothetical protein
MQKRRFPLYRTGLISPLILLTLCSFALAHKIIPASNQQIAMPASNKEITISLKMADKRMITVSEYEGEMIRTGQKEGKMLGITPWLLNDGSVKLDFFEIIKIKKNEVIIGESITSLGSMKLNGSFPQSTSISQISTIQLVAVAKAKEGAEARLYVSCPCCVTCNGETTCGISVQLDCGSCNCR